MQAELPLYECMEDALKSAIYALGGSKKVGPMIWPAKGVEAASRLLNDCLNPSRAERLDPEQLVLVLRSARDVGCYAPFQWFAGECGFDARPVTQAEEVDRVTSVVESGIKTLGIAIASLERLHRRA